MTQVTSATSSSKSSCSDSSATAIIDEFSALSVVPRLNALIVRLARRRAPSLAPRVPRRPARTSAPLHAGRVRLVIGDGLTLVRRETPTPIGQVDLLVRDAGGGAIVVEAKRRGDISGVEQFARCVDLLDRDAHLAPVRGALAAQDIKPQARVLDTDRGIWCATLDYDALKGADYGTPRLC